MGTGALSLGVKWVGHEADHSPQSSAEVKEWVELYLHSPNTPSWCGAQLKHRDNFTLLLPLDNVVYRSWLAFLENSHDGEKSVQNREKDSCKTENLSGDAVMTPSATVGEVTAAGEFRKSCRPGVYPPSSFFV
jgi:hypothetical protein